MGELRGPGVMFLPSDLPALRKIADIHRKTLKAGPPPGMPIGQGLQVLAAFQYVLAFAERMIKELEDVERRMKAENN